VADQGGLFVDGVVRQVLTLGRTVGDQWLRRFVGPLRVQVQLHLLAGIAYELHDALQRARAEACCKQGFDKKHTVQLVAVQDFKGLGQGVVAMT